MSSDAEMTEQQSMDMLLFGAFFLGARVAADINGASVWPLDPRIWERVHQIAAGELTIPHVLPSGQERPFAIEADREIAARVARAMEDRERTFRERHER